MVLLKERLASGEALRGFINVIPSAVSYPTVRRAHARRFVADSPAWN
jgi:hypothetical protein